MQVCSVLQVVFLWNFCMLDPPLEPLSFSLSTFSYMGEQSGTETIPSRMEISLSSTELGWGCILRVAPEGWFRPAKKNTKKHGSTMAAWRHDHAPREPATKDSPNGCEQDRQFSFIGSRCMVCCFIVEKQRVSFYDRNGKDIQKDSSVCNQQ